MKLWNLYRGRDYRIEPTLDRIIKAANYVGKPQREFPAILVGGTNGKGSSCAFLERILREHGYRTGWFVSPHLVEENERWRINGKKISENILAAYIKDLRMVFERFNLTYFEAATLIAILYFRDQNVDVAVMEVGMGGRWDATKVCEATVVGITNVERDHTRWLGKNVEEIAWDKLHLHRKGIPLVLGSSRYPLYTKALEMGLQDLVVAGLDYSYRGGLREGRTLLNDYTFQDIRIPESTLGLLGKWQVDNASFAITMARLFAELDPEKVRRALLETRWEGRMEILRRNPLLVVDGSHNPYAVAKVIKEVFRLFGEVRVLFTGLTEKEWKVSMELIRRYTDKIMITQVSYYRGEPVGDLYRYARELNFKDIKVLDTPADVWFIDEDICAVGSLYLVGEIKKAVKNSVI